MKRVKALAAQKGAAEAAVVVTRKFFKGLLCLLLTASTQAAVLPDDRADALYHSYQGGGMSITGPALMIRKSFADKFSVMGEYYVDNVSSASIDIETTASEYTEQRTQYTLAGDYLHDRSTISFAYTNSEESDYSANTYSFNISQDFFGDLTNITFGYSRGEDEVRQNGRDDFSEENLRQKYRFSLSQIITKNLITAFSWETVADEGFLNNPYRSVRYIDATSPIGYSYQAEVYPRTRHSSAAALRGKYFLPYRAAIKAEYRWFQDTWGIEANNIEVAYTHPYKEDWIFEFKYRYYTQTSADFYSDLFDYQDQQNYLARDKELSAFTHHNIGFSVSWEFGRNYSQWMDRASLNLAYDYLMIDYSDFRDLTKTGYSVGNEPTYSLEAHVVRVFASLWF